jgi:hypothetical protein
VVVVAARTKGKKEDPDERRSRNVSGSYTMMAIPLFERLKHSCCIYGNLSTVYHFCVLCQQHNMADCVILEPIVFSPLPVYILNSWVLRRFEKNESIVFYRHVF